MPDRAAKPAVTIITLQCRRCLLAPLRGAETSPNALRTSIELPHHHAWVRRCLVPVQSTRRRVFPTPAYPPGKMNPDAPRVVHAFAAGNQRDL
jgi:hypothetical protein